MLRRADGVLEAVRNAGGSASWRELYRQGFSLSTVEGCVYRGELLVSMGEGFIPVYRLPNAKKEPADE